MTALTNNEVYKKIDEAIEEMAEKIMNGIKEAGYINEEEVNALARLMEARTKL